jgi:PST family polysaccharide transporter
MLLKLKKIFATDMVKVSVLTGISTVIRMLTGFVSSKVVAVAIGPAGIALHGLLNNFALVIQSLASGGINNGITKHIAQYSDSERKYRLYLSTGFRITAGISLLCGLVLIFGAGYFSVRILKDIQYKAVFYIFGATIILYALNAFLLSVVNGFREFRKYVTINIVSSIAGLVFAVVLTKVFLIFGTLIALVTYQSVVFVITLTMVMRSSWFKWSLFFGRFSKTAARSLGKYSAMAIVSAVAVPFSRMIILNIVIANGESMSTGLDEGGLWNGLNNISNMYLMVVTTSLSVYYLPKLSGLKKDSEIRQEVGNVYKLLIPFLLIASTLIYLFRHLIIVILYDNKFAGMEDLFAFQLAGDLLKMATWVLGYIQVAKGMAKTYIIVEIASCSLFILFSWLLVHAYGTVGATMAYAAAFLCQFLIMVLVFRKLLFGKNGN